MRRLLVPIVIICCVMRSYGQEGYANLYYTVGIPLGNTSDYVDNVSFRGLTAGYEFPVSESWYVGFNSGWQTFYQELRGETATVDNSAFYGDQWRYINVAPILAHAKFVFAPESDVSLFASAAVGTYHYNRRIQFGGLRNVQTKWLFGFYPEIGGYTTLTGGTQLVLSGRYNYASSGGPFDAQGFFSINVGIRAGG